jgi:hypothetical protein
MVLQPHFHAFRVLDSCEILVCDFSQRLTHLVVIVFFSNSMNTCEPNMRFHLFDGFLDSLSYGLWRVRGHASIASFVGPRLYSCDAFIGSSYIVPLEIFIIFLMIALFFF